MWQFISGTGRRYGLQDDWWYDPRRDPVLATDAALEYLGDLHDEFQDWHMAMAAYNCGEGKIRRFLAQDSTRGYWNMPLPQETRFYVPKILAAMIIGHNPERYGFVIDKPEPVLAFDTASVAHCLTIATIAKSAGVSEDTILSLNPSLRRWCTPPNRPTFTLYLPTGTREAFFKSYDALDKTQLVNWHHHIVSKGETISSIAARYRVSAAAIKGTNKIKGNRLARGQSLLIPLAPGDAGKYLEPDVADGSARQTKFKGGTYKVRSGDNLFDIARRFGTTVSSLLAANNLKRGAVIRAGQRIRLGSKGGPAAGDDEGDNHREPAVALRHVPAAGREAPTPANEAGDARAAANLVPREKSPRAAVPSVKTPSAGKFGVHSVEAGETLYSISRSLGVSEEDLSHWNGIRGNLIQVGQKLKYLAPKTASAKIANEPSKASAQDADQEIPAGEDGPGPKAAEAPHLVPVAAAGFVGAAKTEEKQYYVVKAGDSLWDISVRYRCTVQKLKDLNGRLPPILKPGTRIRVK
jgi:membrane-bound lytic murein transglycosylase D